MCDLTFPQDTTLLYWQSGGRRRLTLQVCFRNMKGQKYTNKGFDLLLDETPNFLNHPVILFIAIACACGAFQDYETPAEILAMPMPGDNKIELIWKSELKETPVFRQLRAGKNGEILPWKTKDAREQLARLSVRARYSPPIMPYDIRRGVANTLETSADVTLQQMLQMLGHGKEGVYRAYYQSRLTTANVQSLPGDQYQELRNLAKDLRRPPRDLPKPKRYSKVQLYEKKSLLPNSIERLGDLRDSETQVAVFHRAFPLRGKISDAAKTESFNLWESLDILEALVELANTVPISTSGWNTHM